MTIVFGGLVLGLVFLVINNVKINKRRKEVNLELKAREQKIEELSQERETLQKKISDSHFPDYWEKILREELNLKKIGEGVVAFPIGGEKGTTTREMEEKENLLQKVLEKFKIK